MISLSKFSSLILIWALNSCYGQTDNISYSKVKIIMNITYGFGYSHVSINSEEKTKIPLKLDLYLPENDSNKRPLFMFIHGGCFRSGSKQHDKIINLGKYFASKGWAFASIDYRLARDKGTIPQEWLNFTDSVSDNSKEQFLALYPAHRDAKSVLRWLISNSEKYQIDTSNVVVGGSSASAITAVGIGISEQYDFKGEIEISDDSTLLKCNLDQDYSIKAIVNLWGSKISIDAFKMIYKQDRFDENDPKIFVAHGTNDEIGAFRNAQDLIQECNRNKISYNFYQLNNKGHGC